MENTTMAILVNLARRARWAKRDLRRVERMKLRAPVLLLRARGAELEAWNSLQAAKQLAGRGTR